MIPSFAYYTMLLRNEFVAYCNEKLQEIGLTHGQLFFILYVGKHKDCAPKILAKDLHMDSGHATRTILKLEEHGFLRQTVNETDRRAHLLRLTEKGNQAFQLSHDLFNQWDELVQSKLTLDERESLMTMMQAMVSEKEDDGCVRRAAAAD